MLQFPGVLGAITVPIRAHLPSPSLHFPAAIDFGLCGLCELVTRTFTIRNTEDFATRYQFEVGGPFSISPMRGEIKGNEKATITAQFRATVKLYHCCIAP